MKKILIPFALVVFLLVVSCSSGGSSASSDQTTAPPPNPLTPIPGDAPLPKDDVTAGFPLPQFDTSSLEQKLLDSLPNSGVSAPFLALPTDPNVPFLVDPCYKIERAVEISENKDFKKLKTTAAKAAGPTRCYIESLGNRYDSTKNNWVGDGTLHDVTDKDDKVVSKYIYSTDAGREGPIRYAKFIEFDALGNETLMMMWSNQPKKLVVFSVVDSTDSDKVLLPKKYRVVGAYQNGVNFHLASAVLKGRNDFFDLTRYGVWTQLAYNSANGAFQAIESYRVYNTGQYKIGNAQVLIQGNADKGHAGLVETKYDEFPLLPFPRRLITRFKYGSFDTTGAQAAYQSLVDKMTEQDNPEVQRLLQNRVVRQVIDDASSPERPRPTGLLKPSEVVTLETMKRVYLPDFKDKKEDKEASEIFQY